MKSNNLELDNLEPDDIEPISFELANGEKIEVKAGEFYEKIDPAYIHRGIKAQRLYAIRVYCMSDSRLRKIDELRDGHECTRASVPYVFEALTEHLSSRDYLEHDDADAFCDWLREVAEEKWGTPEDAAKVLNRLPKINDPDSYDQGEDFLSDED
jgi:hypothetical protein